jgi:pimeloyl-ACP methyl ester carboxylesterase
MRIATDDGIELHVEELGEGPPVIMLHGLLVGNMTTWYWTAAPELAKSHRVILFDLRGHGLSQRAAKGYDVGRITSDLESLVLRMTDEPVSMVGHSYGAVVALTFALRHPNRVKKLALVEAPLPPSSLTELDGFLGAGQDVMLDALPLQLRATVAARGRQGARFVDSVRFLVQESSLVEDLRAAEDVSDEALRALRCPLLAVYGANSSCRPVGERLARVVPGASLVELSGGHFLPLENPRLLTETLTRFIHA